MNVVFIVPCFNMSKNFEHITLSLSSQNDDRWSCIMIDDISTDDTWEKISNLCLKDKRFHGIKNSDKKYALKNIVSAARMFQDRTDVVIAVIDGDDSLCNNETVSLLLNEYDSGEKVVWTAHKWDINGMNISRKMPKNVDPYSWAWSTSHLRTFSASLLKNICDNNFKDLDDEWFQRGYDQALMLPILSKTQERKYIDKVCYQYNINSVSIKNRSWEEPAQISTINIIRARGFIHE